MGLQAIDEHFTRFLTIKGEKRFADNIRNGERPFSGRQICSTISKYVINSLTAYLPEILRNLGEIVREFRFFDDEETVLIGLN
jgi:hypothetical protein